MTTREKRPSSIEVVPGAGSRTTQSQGATDSITSRLFDIATAIATPNATFRTMPSHALCTGPRNATATARASDTTPHTTAEDGRRHGTLARAGNLAGRTTLVSTIAPREDVPTSPAIVRIRTVAITPAAINHPSTFVCR